MSRYTVAITADSRVIVGLIGTAGEPRHGARVDLTGSSYHYTAEGASSAEVIDQVFKQLEQVGAKPAGVRVSVRPVEVVKP